MNKTDISWASYVWNPVTGCTKVSQGCKNCYAEGIAKRFWGERKFTDVICHEDRLDQPLHIKKPGRVFVNSMSDLFHPDVPFNFILNVFYKMATYDRHTYIVLTKRPLRMLEFFRYWTENNHDRLEHGYPYFQSPLKNVWLGVSIEDQKTADERIPLLLQTPAAVRFVSYEPALGIIDWIKIASYVHRGIISYDQPNFPRGLDWVIMGCESGPNRRPMDIEWARSMRDQCQAANVPFFLKQMEIDGKVVKMPALDGVVYDQYPEEK